jgi:hypothetical protein
MNINAAPMALRVFQQAWPHLVSNINNWLCWFIKQMHENFRWELARGRMRPPSLADDADVRGMLLQLMSADRVSGYTALGPLGIDDEQELKRILQERRRRIKMEKRLTEEQDQEQLMQDEMAARAQALAQGGQPGAPMAQGPLPQGSIPPAGGMGMGMGGMGMGGMGGMGGGQSGQSVSLEERQVEADQMAQQLLTMPYEIRRSELVKIKRTDQTLHALVKAKLDQMRQQAKSEGGYQMIQQMAAQQGQPAAGV